MNFQSALAFLQKFSAQELGGAAVAVLALGFVFWPGSSGAYRKRSWDLPKFVWGLDRRLRAALVKGRYGSGTYLGIAGGSGSVVLSARARESHMQIVGPTRVGKSQLLLAIAAQDMKKKMPVFFMEAKGDHSDFDQFLKAADLVGQRANVRYFNPQDQRSMTFNPIRPVPGQNATAVANQIARAIGREPTSSGQGKDYYSHVDFAKIQNMAEIFCKIGREFTLRDCFYYFSFRQARERAYALCQDRRLAAMAELGFQESEDCTGLTSMIRPWITGRLGELLNSYNPQIKLEEIFAEGQLAYFAIPVAHLQVLANPLGRMLITGLIDLSSWRQQARPKPSPASIILDEFAQFVTPSFTSLIETVGSARLWTTLSHQDLNQLKRVQGAETSDFSSSVFTNTSGCKVTFRTPNPEDAEFWAATLGTYTTFEDTERVTKSFLGESKSGEVSRRWVEQFKIHPNRLKVLPGGTALIFSPGQLECMSRTARIYPLLRDQIAELPVVSPREQAGLDLASAVPDPELRKEREAKARVAA